MISREELAAQIYAASHTTVQLNGSFQLETLTCPPSYAFDSADYFFKECERQKLEPKACKHKWATYTTLGRPEDTTEYCLNCDAKKPEPPKPACEHLPEWRCHDGSCAHCGMPSLGPAKYEPTKPERVARTWKIWCDSYGNLSSYVHMSDQGKNLTLITVREVIE